MSRLSLRAELSKITGVELTEVSWREVADNVRLTIQGEEEKKYMKQQAGEVVGEIISLAQGLLAMGVNPGNQAWLQRNGVELGFKEINFATKESFDENIVEEGETAVIEILTMLELLDSEEITKAEVGDEVLRKLAKVKSILTNVKTLADATIAEATTREELVKTMGMAREIEEFRALTVHVEGSDSLAEKYAEKQNLEAVAAVLESIREGGDDDRVISGKIREIDEEIERAARGRAAGGEEEEEEEGEREKMREVLVQKRDKLDELNKALAQDRAARAPARVLVESIGRVERLEEARSQKILEIDRLRKELEMARTLKSTDEATAGGYEAEISDFSEIIAENAQDAGVDASDALAAVLREVQTSVEQQSRLMRQLTNDGDRDGALERGDGALERELQELISTRTETEKMAVTALAVKLGIINEGDSFDDISGEHALIEAYTQLHQSVDRLLQASEAVDQAVQQQNRIESELKSIRFAQALGPKSRRKGGDMVAHMSRAQEMSNLIAGCDHYLSELRNCSSIEDWKAKLEELAGEESGGAGVSVVLQTMLDLPAAGRGKVLNYPAAIELMREGYVRDILGIKDQLGKLSHSAEEVRSGVTRALEIKNREITEEMTVFTAAKRRAATDAGSTLALLGSGKTTETIADDVDALIERMTSERATAVREIVDHRTLELQDEAETSSKEITEIATTQLQDRAEYLCGLMKSVFNERYQEGFEESFAANSIGKGSPMRNFDNINLDYRDDGYSIDGPSTLTIPVTHGSAEDFKTLVENYFEIEGCEVDRTGDVPILIVPIDRLVSTMTKDDIDTFIDKARGNRDAAKRAAITPVSSSGDGVKFVLSAFGAIPLVALIAGYTARAVGKTFEVITAATEHNKLNRYVAAATGGVIGGVTSLIASWCNGVAKTSFDFAATMSSSVPYKKLAEEASRRSKNIERSEEQRLRPEDNLGRQSVRGVHKTVAVVTSAISVVPYAVASAVNIIGDPLLNLGARLRRSVDNSNFFVKGCGYIASAVPSFVGSLCTLVAESFSTVGKILAAPGTNLKSVNGEKTILSFAGEISRFSKGIEDKTKMTVAEKLVIVDRQNFAPSFKCSASVTAKIVDPATSCMDAVQNKISVLAGSIPILHKNINVVLSVKADEANVHTGPKAYIQLAKFTAPDSLMEYRVLQNQNGDRIIVDKATKLVTEFSEKESQSFIRGFAAEVTKLIPVVLSAGVESEKDRDARQAKCGVTLESLKSISDTKVLSQLEKALKDKASGVTRSISGSTATYTVKVADRTVFEVTAPVVVTVEREEERKGGKSGRSQSQSKGRTPEQTVTLAAAGKIEMKEGDKKHSVINKSEDNSVSVKADSMQLLSFLERTEVKINEQAAKKDAIDLAKRDKSSRGRSLERGAPPTGRGGRPTTTPNRARAGTLSGHGHGAASGVVVGGGALELSFNR